MNQNVINYQVFRLLIQSDLTNLIDCVDTINLFVSCKFMKDNIKYVKAIIFPMKAMSHKLSVRRNDNDNDILKSICIFPLIDLYMSEKFDDVYDYYNHVDNLTPIANLHSSLKKLYLNNCVEIDNYDLVDLAKLKLIELSLYACFRIRDCGLRALDFSRIINLDVSFCEITDDGLQYIACAQQLKYLKAWGCRFTEDGLKYIAHLQLNYLDLSSLKGPHNFMAPYVNISPTDKGLIHFARMPLTDLSIREWRITKDGHGLRHLANLPLEKLDISHTDITANGLNYLMDLPLDTLCIEYCKKITFEDLKKLTNVNHFEFE